MILEISLGALVLLTLLCFFTLRKFQSRPPTATATKTALSRDVTQPVHVKGALGVHVVCVSDAEHATHVQQAASSAHRWLPGMPTDSLFPSTLPEDTARFKTVMARALREYECRNSVIRRVCDEFVADLLRAAPKVSDLFVFVHERVAAAMVRFAFGSNCGTVLIESARAFDRASLASVVGLIAPRLARVIFPASGRRMDAAKAERVRILQEIRAGNALFDDALLTRMVAANTIERPLTDDELISNAIGIGVGGSDSTSSALTSTLVHLAQDKELAERVASEFRGVDLDAMWRLADFDSLLPVTKRAVDEAIRVHPPFASLVPRYAVEDFALDGNSYCKGNWFAVNLAAVHQSKAPLEFDADRTPLAPSMAFGVGPRSCIAKALALRLLVASVAHIAGNYHLECELLNSGAEFGQRSGVQQPARPFVLKVTKRNDS
jgi:cytochrome P450